MTRAPTFAPPRVAPDATTYDAARPPPDRGTHFARPAAADPRLSAPPIERLTFGGRLRAMVFSLVALTLGVTAFGYALRQIHHILFVTSSTAAKVAGPVYTVQMPREGTFSSLVPEDGLVKRGAPIASFEAPVLDLVKGQALAANISAEQLAKLSSQMVKGTISSPCDCRVQTTFVANAQYASRGQPLFELVPQEIKDPYVMARFRFDQADKIVPGTTVHFRVAGDSQQRRGKIEQLRVPNQPDTVGGDLIAMIEPSEPLPPDLLNRPAMVDVGGIAQFNPLAMAASLAAAPADAPAKAAPQPAAPAKAAAQPAAAPTKTASRAGASQ